MKNKSTKKYWDAIDLLYPEHHPQFDIGMKTYEFCTDDNPCGSSQPCERCIAILYVEKRLRVTIWPRSKNKNRRDY